VHATAVRLWCVTVRLSLGGARLLIPLQTDSKRVAPLAHWLQAQHVDFFPPDVRRRCHNQQRTCTDQLVHSGCLLVTDRCPTGHNDVLVPATSLRVTHSTSYPMPKLRSASYLYLLIIFYSESGDHEEGVWFFRCSTASIVRFTMRQSVAHHPRDRQAPRDPGSPLTKVRSTRVAERQGVHHLPKCHNHRPDCVSWGSRVDLGQPVIHLRRERHYPPGPLKASVFQRPWIRVSGQSPPPSSP
jgi:hypothetical protein